MGDTGARQIVTLKDLDGKPTRFMVAALTTDRAYLVDVDAPEDGTGQYDRAAAEAGYVALVDLDLWDRDVPENDGSRLPVNAYDPRVHGVCGYPRPTMSGRCHCGLALVRVGDRLGHWTHWVDAKDAS